MNAFTENHYKPFINGKRCSKWSRFLPVNYGNEKSNPRGWQTNIYSIDTTKGCSNNCIGCYGARMSKRTNKNFGWIKNVTLRGKPIGEAFLWTSAPNPIPESILNSDIGINITVDPMRDIEFINRALRTIKAIGPNRVIIAFKIYPNNRESINRCKAIANFLRKRGYKRFIHILIRLFNKKQAQQTNSILCPMGSHEKKIWYKAYSVKGLGISCGSIGSGKCIDCMFCYKIHKAKYRIGTMSDPLLRPKHTEKELLRLKFI